MRPSTRHTSAQQTMVNQHLDFIVNRPRGHSANSVPYLAPPVLANVAAFFAKPLPLGAWPAALPWEHSSRWSYPSPRGSSHSDADHAWVRLPGNGSPLVRRCDKFPIVFRRCQFHGFHHLGRTAPGVSMRTPGSILWPGDLRVRHSRALDPFVDPMSAIAQRIGDSRYRFSLLKTLQ